MMGEKMWCEVILPRSRIMGVITECYFYQSLSINLTICLCYSTLILFNLKVDNWLKYDQISNFPINLKSYKTQPQSMVL